MENSYYEGYIGSFEVTSLQNLNFFGEIIQVGIHFPGSWHDINIAAMSGFIYPNFSNHKTPLWFPIFGDSTFVATLQVGWWKDCS